MTDATQIYKATTRLSFADQHSFQRDLRGAISPHVAAIAAHHPRGQAFVDEVFGAQDGFTAALGVMDKETLEADGALGDHTTLGESLRGCVEAVDRKIETIEALEEESPDLIRAVRKAYGTSDSNLSMSRRSHVERRMQQLVGAHALYGALLLKYNMTQAQLDEAAALWAKLPQSAAKLAKELDEKERAVKAAHAAEAEAVKAVNKVIAIAHDLRATAPALFDALASVTAKHRDKLLG